MPSHDLTREIIGAAIKVHRELGPGLLESAYEACLAHDLRKLGMKVETSETSAAHLRTALSLIADFEQTWSWKVKSLSRPNAKTRCIRLTTLSSSPTFVLLKIPVGLLINFHVVFLRDGIKRMVNNYREPMGLVI